LTDKDCKHVKVGSTLDDASGEAFDKVARLLGLRYPGGPEISKIATKARENNLVSPTKLPRPMIKDDSLNFSYAGLKTAVRVFLEKNPDINEEEKSALAMEFENAVVETLIDKTRKAIEKYNPRALAVGGGVSANNHLRNSIEELVNQYEGVSLFLSQRKYSTDNAIMIALVAYISRDCKEDSDTLCANSSLSFPAI